MTIMLVLILFFIFYFYIEDILNFSVFKMIDIFLTILKSFNPHFIADIHLGLLKSFGSILFIIPLSPIVVCPSDSRGSSVRYNNMCWNYYLIPWPYMIEIACFIFIYRLWHLPYVQYKWNKLVDNFNFGRYPCFDCPIVYNSF